MASMTFNGAEKENFYRCPACGTRVDNAQPEEVRLHHDHILHPDRYSQPASTQTIPAADPKELLHV